MSDYCRDCGMPWDEHLAAGPPGPLLCPDQDYAEGPLHERPRSGPAEPDREDLYWEDYVDETGYA
jgi:hypothetical protein